jgi:hypothetical protein
MFGERTVTAECGAHPRRSVHVFHGDPDPVQRAPYLAPGPRLVGLGAPAACPVRVQGDHRTEPGVVPPDPVELIYENFGRRDVATPDRRGDLISAGPAQPGHRSSR